MKLNTPSISLFLPSLTGGGAERVALNLVEGFIERGLNVDLVLQNAVGTFLSKVPSKVRVIDLRSSGIVPKTIDLISYLRREQPEVLLSLLDNVNSAGWAQRFTGVPTRVVVSVHNNLSQDFRGIKGKLKPYLVQFSFPWADEIIAVSQGVAEDLARISGIDLENIRVIYNPVVTPNLFEKAQEPIAHPWFVPGEPPVLLGVGRLVVQKDFPTLIRAFALVRQCCPVRLMILGEGEKRPHLEALVQELGLENEVSLPGFAQNPYSYMARSAVFVLSSAWEGLPTVLIEAMATGTSVVATNCPSGPAEILQGGCYGKLVPVGDVAALAEAILATLSQPTNSELLRQRSRAFSVDQVVDQYLTVLKVDKN
jgi:glycosyltransferase involved in cell wall biosynthesis